MPFHPVYLCRLAIAIAGALLIPCIAAEDYPLTLDDITVRDPFIYADTATQTYFLYAQTGNHGNRGANGVEAYRSKDLVHWSQPALVFEKPDDFWGGSEIWAPEMHRLGGRYYLFVSFNGREGGRGTQILRADSPAGPFAVLSPDANTPPGQRALDGTPFVGVRGQNWLIYCHEWVQIGDGAVLAVRMREDWSRRVGEPVHLFNASDAPWVRPLGGRAGQFVTDGCFLHRAASGDLWMIWASFTGDRGRTYAVGLARSTSGEIQGPWLHAERPVFAENGGHAMLFRSFDGNLRATLHQPNGGAPARAKLFSVKETTDSVELIPWQPSPAADQAIGH